MKDTIKRWKSTPKIFEFLRYCIVGVVAVGVHYGVYLLLNLWICVNVAFTIGYVISVCVHWWLTFRFTFCEKITIGRTGGYLLCNGVNYVLQILFLNFFLMVGLSEQWAPIPVYCMVVPINFILVRLVVKNSK